MNCEDESQFSQFLMNRWLSFYNPEVAQFINDATNKQLPCSDKSEMYELYFNLLPKLKFKRITYIKKTKKEPEKEALIIVSEFQSKKEYNNNVELMKELCI